MSDCVVPFLVDLAEVLIYNTGSSEPSLGVSPGDVTGMTNAVLTTDTGTDIEGELYRTKLDPNQA